MLASLPMTCQSQSPSPYFDQSLYRFDEKVGSEFFVFFLFFVSLPLIIHFTYTNSVTVLDEKIYEYILLTFFFMQHAAFDFDFSVEPFFP